MEEIMGLFDGLLFVSKEEKERRQSEMRARVFPFGEEEQRNYADEVLRELFPEVKDKQERILGYVAAKNEYIACGKGEDGILKAAKLLKRLGWRNKPDVAKMISFIEIESEIECIEDYPTAADVEIKLKGLN